MRHVEWEAYTEVLLGQSGIYNTLHDESVHNKWSAWTNSVQDICWKKTESITPESVWKILYVHVPNQKQQKLDSKSVKCILVGYSSEKNGYKCFDPSTQMVRVTRDVVFEESASWYEPISYLSYSTKDEMNIKLKDDIDPSTQMVRGDSGFCL